MIIILFSLYCGQVSGVALVIWVYCVALRGIYYSCAQFFFSNSELAGVVVVVIFIIIIIYYYLKLHYRKVFFIMALTHFYYFCNAQMYMYIQVI